MKRNQQKTTLLIGVVVAVGLLLAGCAGSKPVPGEIFPCAADSKIEKSITAEAELTEFACVVKPWKGSDTLHFNVAVKNISKQPQRFRVNIFLVNGKAVGGLLPRKTKKGLVKPGATATFSYPVKGMDCGPDSVMVMVKTMSK